MNRLACLGRSASGSAAAELALVTPLLLALMFGSVELGNYFYNEHILVKAVRDGARYAARQHFDNYDACTGSVGEPILTNTRNLVKKGVLVGGSDRLMDWDATTIDVTMRCQATAGPQTMRGIYKEQLNGAPIVIVSADVPYVPLVASFGFSGAGLVIHASQEAAVMGI